MDFHEEVGYGVIIEARRTTMTPRMQIVWTTLEAAKDAGAQEIVAACRRIITADRIGWRKHGNPADYRMVREAYEATR